MKTFLKTLGQMIDSKKAVFAIAGFLAGVAAKLGLNISIGEIAVLLSPIVAYILGQGLADTGKEAVKKANTAPPTNE